MIITAKEADEFAKRVEEAEQYQAKTSWLRELVNIARQDDELSRERIHSLAKRVTPEEWDAIGADRVRIPPKATIHSAEDDHSSERSDGRRLVVS